MSKISTEQAQARIAEVQSLYREWLALQPKLTEAQQDWRRSMEVMQAIRAFYDKEYLPLYEALEEGLPVSLKTEGEYSVMSEDALYDAIGDQYHLAWSWMRMAVKVLDPESETE